MSQKTSPQDLIISSSRFGDISVPADSVIEFPAGLIGFPNERRFVVLDHKPPFSWLHSVENSELAFVIVDGSIFGQDYQVKVPYGDVVIDLKENDEWAMIIIITIRPDPSMTTANLKAPVFVNLRNRKALQIILDDARYSARYPLWSQKEAAATSEKPPEGQDKK